MKDVGRRLGKWIVVFASMPLLAGCAVHFEPGTANRVVDAAGNPLACNGAANAVFNYAKDKTDKGIYIDIRNTGTCPMEARIVVGGNTAETIQVAKGTRSLTRFDTKKNFQVRVACLATDEDPATCVGTVALTPRKKGKGAITELVLRQGDAIPTPTPGFSMQCNSQPLQLPVTLRNASKNKIVVEFEAENTCPIGACPNFSILADGGQGMVPVVTDGFGGTPTVKQVNLAKGKSLTFSVQCSGTGQTSQTCDGNARIKVLN